MRELIKRKPRRVVVKCGRDEVPWDLFVAAWKIVRQLPGEWDEPTYHKAEPNTNAAEILADFRRNHMLANNSHLLFLMQYFAHKNCKDPRDKVFALLGLAHDRHHLLLSSLGYHQGANEIPKDITVYSLLGEGDLDVILYRGQGYRDARLPSWVPDYSDGGNVWQLTRHSFDEAYSTGSKGPIRVEALGDGRNTGVWEARGIIHQRPSPNLSRGSMAVLGHHVDTIAKVDLIRSEVRGPWEPPFEYYNTTKYPLGGTFENALARPILFDRDRQGQRYGKTQWLAYYPRLWNPWERDRVRGYCLIKTKRGLIGLVRDTVLSDDWICRLYGCSVPVVLRRTGPERFIVMGGW